MSKGTSMLLALVTLVVAGVMTSSASALPDISVSLPGPLKCYEVSNFSVAENRAGNWNTSTCMGTEQAKLSSKWVLAEPLVKLPSTTSLWCAKLTPYKEGTNSATGTFTNATCTASTKENGEFADVIVPGNGYPLHIEITLLTQATKLSAGSEKTTLKGVGLLLLYLISQLTALGTFEVLFLAVESAEKVKCNSAGDKSGEILTSGTFHIVYTSLSGSANGLQLGVLFLPLPVSVTCGEEKIKIQGSALSSISGAGTEGTELTNLAGSLTGNGKGVPALKVFYNDAGEAKEAKLESNFGAGFVQTAEETGSVSAKALEGEMFVITSR
jgi:hypothetical protein